VSSLGEHDALVIAGKGHEDYQIVGAEVRAFSDRDEAVKAARALGGTAVSEAA
jgi:UDP-N-acetylmuramoyl-L-alanyl-D-glutamate--2,6-diaminopimelate ligase